MKILMTLFLWAACATAMTPLAFQKETEVELIVYGHTPGFGYDVTLKHVKGNRFRLVERKLPDTVEIDGDFRYEVKAKLPGRQYKTLILEYQGKDYLITVRQ